MLTELYTIPKIWRKITHFILIIVHKAPYFDKKMISLHRHTKKKAQKDDANVVYNLCFDSTCY